MSAITPMYDFLRHSPSEMMSMPAAACICATYGTAASMVRWNSSLEPSSEASSSMRSCTKRSLGMEPTTVVGKSLSVTTDSPPKARRTSPNPR